MDHCVDMRKTFVWTSWARIRLCTDTCTIGTFTTINGLINVDVTCDVDHFQVT